MDKTALFKISYGLYVLSAKDGAKDNGCITNTVIQVTDQPLQIAVTVNKANFTHDMIMKTGAFNISVISEEAEFSLFQRFGFQSGKNVDKFSEFDSVKRAGNGIYYITQGCNAYLGAKLVKTVDLGTHTMFIGEVTEAENINTVPSATYSYYHAHIKPQPQKAKKTGWRCRICGYVYEGDTLPDDFICPICKHGASDFERI